MDTDIFESSGAAEDQYEEELTAGEVLQKLEDAWLNEKHAPELLESKMEIVECMLDQVRTMEENLTKVKKGDIRVPVHRMETQRIKFLVNSYLRLRLRKIQSNIFCLTSEQNKDNPSRMTPEVRKYSDQWHWLIVVFQGGRVRQYLPTTVDLAF